MSKPEWIVVICFLVFVSYAVFRGIKTKRAKKRREDLELPFDPSVVYGNYGDGGNYEGGSYDGGCDFGGGGDGGGGGGD